LTVEEALQLMRDVSASLGLSAEDGEVVAEHLVDDELRGVVGMSRIFIVADDVARHGAAKTSPMRLDNESASFAKLDGGAHLGFVVAEHATRLAISKAKSSGIAVVGADNHRFSGTLAYYVEMAARSDLVAMAVASGSFGSVAPYGGREGKLDTNPIAFGFPAEGEPIVWDIATSAISGSEVYKRLATGEPLPDGVAIGPQGRPTKDAREALEGAFLPWGGHRGSGLAMVVRLLAMLCGVEAFAEPGDEFAFLILAVDPSMLLPLDDFKDKAAQFARGIRATAPAEGTDEVRMPFDRSVRDRRRRREEGIELERAVYARLDSIRRTHASL
jgi:delta1-piperideine-2-carboxylate reductase